MGPFCRRIQFHEIGDQKWLPRYFHAKFQDFLTFYWTFHLRGLQAESPAAHVASVLARVLPQAGKNYTYVDFCAGAGGPTSVIERLWNDKSGQQEGNSLVDFVLTDLHPNIPAWSEASKGRKNLTFIEQPVDATMTPASLKSRDGRKIFRLYNLSFHHFDDNLASSILRESLETSDGFGIFELQERTFTSFTNITLIVLFGLLITPLYFWRSPAHLFFTYVIPLVPLIVLYDGYVSALRTRTPAEVLALAKGCSASLGGWDIISGHDLVTWPTGYMTWVVGIKRSS